MIYKLLLCTLFLTFNFIDLKSEFNDIVTTSSLIDRFRYYLITIPIIIIILVLVYLRFIKDSISSDEKKFTGLNQGKYNNFPRRYSKIDKIIKVLI